MKFAVGVTWTERITLSKSIGLLEDVLSTTLKSFSIKSIWTCLEYNLTGIKSFIPFT